MVGILGVACMTTACGSLGSGAWPVTLIDAAPFGSTECVTPQAETSWCDSSPAPVLSGGPAIRLTEGVPLRFRGAGAAGRDRICTAGAYVMARADSTVSQSTPPSAHGATSVWVLSGAGCASSVGGVVSTIDGRRVGVVSALLSYRDPGSDGSDVEYLPAALLDAGMIADPLLSGVAQVPSNVRVAIGGCRTQVEALLTEANTRFVGAVETKPGDQGASVSSDGKLVGILVSRQTIASADQISRAISELSPAAVVGLLP